MFQKTFKDLERISQAVGNCADYVQGGGGNTSVKLDHELMAVKASGYQLNEITEKEGFVVINYKNIKDYYANINLNANIDFEKDSKEFVQNNIVELDGIKTLRPSVEAGFHSILKRYVIHTHSVYANILCCSIEGKDIAEEILEDTEYTFLWIPYVDPGFHLTLKIQEEMNRYFNNNNGNLPHIIFMENHGLIVHSDEAEECIQMHTKVNELIKDFLNITTPYPDIKLVQEDDKTYISHTDYLADFYRQNSNITEEYFDEYVLYPDQLVYLNGSISINEINNKLNINTDTGQIIYKTGLKEARTLEETLLAYVYVIEQIKHQNLTLRTMTKEQIDFIKNWESEKYRKSLLK